MEWADNPARHQNFICDTGTHALRMTLLKNNLGPVEPFLLLIRQMGYGLL